MHLHRFATNVSLWRRYMVLLNKSAPEGRTLQSSMSWSSWIIYDLWQWDWQWYIINMLSSIADTQYSRFARSTVEQTACVIWDWRHCMRGVTETPGLKVYIVWLVKQTVKNPCMTTVNLYGATSQITSDRSTGLWTKLHLRLMWLVGSKFVCLGERKKQVQENLKLA